MNATQTLTSGLDRVVATAVNGIEVLRYGGLRVDAQPSPYDVVAREPVHRLRHYFPKTGQDGGPRQPVLLVPPLMQVADVWDISPSTSAVAMLHERGLDPWVVDFGDPAVEPGGADRTFSDHVRAVADAITRVREETGRDVHIGGYSQGGVFCYVAAAWLASAGVASIFVLGSPVGSISVEKFVPERLLWDAARMQAKVLGKTGLPRWFVAQGFNWMTPQRTIRNDIDFVLALHDRESLLPREPQRQFLKQGAWLGWSGPAIQELIELLGDNRLIEGGVVIGDRTVGLSDITCPVLIFIGEADQFGPAPLVRRIVEAAPNAQVYECVLPVGHFGLPVSTYAKEKTWPGTAAFIRWSVGDGELPDYIHRLSADDVDPGAPSADRSPLATLTYGAGLAAQTLVSTPPTVARSVQRVGSTVRELVQEGASQLPRLLRLERMGPGTRVSYGHLLQEAARGRGDDVAFLFADRAHTYAAAQRRTDHVVRGLLSVGVRRGEHVGVLMDMRPSALITLAALNRIGAVSVLLRPGEDLAREAGLGQLTKVIADPENAADAADLGVPVHVLGGGGGDRTLPGNVIDLERIDPATVRVPAWYVANPGRARDLAFILFSGHGWETRADRITNGRWATSAYAAASAAALTPRDTVYSMSPLHHGSGLLLTTAAPIASGARLAMATSFDADTFWPEVRRYGATVVPYTWTMLNALVSAPPQPEERSHPIRLFVGSGMPTGLWRRVDERFGPAAVLELYASTRTDAILGNVSDRKVGSLGRPLPGTPQVRLVAYDEQTGRPRTGPDGYVVTAGFGEVGLLLVKVDPRLSAGNDVPLRGVFTADDAWACTGDLFRIDTDGDFWFVDSLAALIRTDHGPVSPHAVENALGGLDAVDLVACHPVTDDATGTVQAVAAVTVRPGRRLDVRSIEAGLAGIPPERRPDVVHVVERLPMTSWHRPSIVVLQAAGSPGPESRSWRLDRATGTYHR